MGYRELKPLNWEEIGRFVRFGITGAMNTLVDFSTFFIFSGILGAYLAQVAAYTLATLNSYFVNRKWTFRKDGAFEKQEFRKFLVVNFFSLTLSLLCLKLFYGFLNLPRLTSKILASGFTLPVNYLGSRLWVFRKQPVPE